MNYFKNQYGFSLLTTFLTIILISVLGISLLAVTANTMKTSTNERQDQSVFYIAESGINLKKAEITNLLAIASQKAKVSLDDYIENVVKPAKEGEEFDLKAYYRNQLEHELDLLIPTEYKQTFSFFESQNGASPSATVTTKKTSSFDYLITSAGKIDGKTRILNQTITVNFNYDGTEYYKNQGSSNFLPTLPYNSCIAVMSNGAISSERGGGTFIGDFYSKEAININSSPSIKGNILSPESITISGTPKDVQNIYSKKDIHLSGSMTLNGNIIAHGHVTSNAKAGGNIISTNGGVSITGGSINKDVLASQSSSISNGTIQGNFTVLNGGVSITGGSINKDVLASQSSSISNGTIQGNFTVLNGDLSLKGGKVNGNVGSKDNVIISKYPTIQKNVYGKNIKVEEYSTIGGTYYYSDTIQYKQEPKNLSKSPEAIQNYFQSINLPTIDNIEAMLARKSSSNENCNIISDMSVPTLSEPDYRLPTSDAIAYGQSLNNVNSFISNNNLILPSSHSGTETIEFTEDIYFNKLSVDKSLVIDLNGQSRTLYLDELSMSADGKINIINPGQLTIFVKDKINIISGAKFNDNGAPNTASIVYTGSNKLEFAGGTAINANLYIKDADLTMTSGGRVNGSIYSYGQKNIVISGGASINTQVIYAPNSHISQSGGGNVKGNIYADDYTFSDGVVVDASTGTGTLPPPTLPPTSTIDLPNVDTMLDEESMLEL